MASTTVGNLLAAALALPFAGDLAAVWAPKAMATLLWLGIVQMGLAYMLFLRGLRTMPAAAASLLAMLEPVFNPLWVWLGTGETPGPWSLAGGGVVLGTLAARSWWLARHPA